MEFIEQLPYEAARWSLAEVGPFDKDWYSEVGDRLFDFIRGLTGEAMVGWGWLSGMSVK